MGRGESEEKDVQRAEGGGGGGREMHPGGFNPSPSRQVRVPQKWVGSSVAIGFDAASSWTGDEAAARAQVIVKIFDWGRSELNVASKYSVMTAAERSDRIEFWRNYRMGMNKLSFEAARFYHHRFNSTDPFPNLRVRVWDFDSLTDNDLIGSTELRLEPSASSVTVPLFLSTSAKDKPCGSLTYAIQWVEASPSSRLAGWWRVTLEKAEGLPAMDLSGTSDPLATLTATSRDGSFRTTWQTRVIERELNPTWNESFEVPVARPGTRRLAEALETGPGLGAASELPSPEHFASILPAPIMIHDEEEVSKTNNRLVSMACFGAWNELLDSIQPQTIFEALE